MPRPYLSALAAVSLALPGCGDSPSETYPPAPVQFFGTEKIVTYREDGVQLIFHGYKLGNTGDEPILSATAHVKLLNGDQVLERARGTAKRTPVAPGDSFRIGVSFTEVHSHQAYDCYNLYVETGTASVPRARTEELRLC